jgi:hypothetical protein
MVKFVALRNVDEFQTAAETNLIRCCDVDIHLLEQAAEGSNFLS